MATEPAEFARETQQRPGIVTGTKDP